MTYRSHLVGLLVNAATQGPKVYYMASTAALSAADAAGYISDGWDKGMREGDLVLVYVAGTAGAASTWEDVRTTITGIGLHMVTADPTESAKSVDLSDNLLASYGDTD
jgi:hypothetical protein